MSRCLVLVVVLAGLSSLAGEPPARPKSLAPEQQEKLKERERLLQEANKMITAGQTTDAIAAVERALAIEREVFQALGSVAWLEWLGKQYLEREDFAAARKARQEVLAIQTKVLGKGHWRVTDARIERDHADQVASLCPEDRRRLQEVKRMHARVAQLNREYKGKEAISVAQQALDIERQVLGERHPHCAASLNNLADNLQWEGEYAKAEALFQQALDIGKQTLGERHPNYALVLNNLAGMYKHQGEYAKAEPLYNQALDITGETLGERASQYALCLNSLAGLYLSKGEYAKAEPLFTKARDLCWQVLGDRHSNYATSLNNLAALYHHQGEYAKAERLYKDALESTEKALGGKRHHLYANALNNLALLYAEQEECAKAEPLFQQALDITEKTLGKRSSLYATTLNNLAHMYRAQEQYRKAEHLFQQALDIYKDANRDRELVTAHCLNNLASLYNTQGEYAKEESMLHQALAALRLQPERPSRTPDQLTPTDLRPHPITVSSLAQYYRLLERSLGSRPTHSQLRSANHAVALALDVRDRLRQEVLGNDADKLLHGARAHDLVSCRIGLCQRLFLQESRLADLEAAFATAEQGTARVFLEQLGKARAHAVGRVSAELRHQETNFRLQLRGLDDRITREQAKPPDKRDPQKVGELLDEQKQVEARLVELIRRMEKEYPQYAALKYPKPCSLADARACLADNEVALLFVPGYEKSFVVLVEARPASGDKAVGLTIFALPPSDEIADRISSLSDTDTLALPAASRSAAKEAYQMLLAPLRDCIKGKDLVIVPNGPLCLLPFEVLVEDGKYLIENHRIRYVPSLTALHMVRLWEKERSRPPQPLWALGDPAYEGALASASRDAQQEIGQREGRRDVAFRPLVYSGQEVRAIAQLLKPPAGNILTGPRALEANVKEASASGTLEQARYVHFATHGVLGFDVGQQPALVLSLVGNDGRRDEDGGVNDGFLRLDEVTRLRLNADLVVLSACRTGQGRLHNGEGVTGLARAFLYAGSRAVVSSLWSVDDRQTANLMTSMYRKLQQGWPATDALREAKLEMIRAGKPPLFWAPFILIGGEEPAPTAMVLTTRGAVSRQRKETRPLRAMDLLRPGDVLTAADGEAVLVFLEDGRRQRLKPRGKATVGEQGCTPAEAVEEQEKVKLSAGQLSGLRELARSGRGAVGVLRGEGPPTPQVVTPLYGAAVLTDRPTLTWLAVDKADSYQVQVLSYDGKRLIWKATTSAPSLAYPEKEPALRTGTKYLWRVSARMGEDKDLGRVVDSKFITATKAEVEELASLKTLVAGGDVADLLLAAATYEAHGVYGEALALYEKLPDEANVQVALASYYERGGRADKAKAAREKAKKLGAMLPED